MIKIFLSFALLLSGLEARSQPNINSKFYAPQKIEQTIGQKYILLPTDSSKKEYDYLLHKWVDSATELPAVPAIDGGKTIVTLQEIVAGNHAKLTIDTDTSYFQYFENADDRVMSHFALLADYEKAKSFIAKRLWRKADKTKVTITAVNLTPDNNAPFKFTYRYANGKTGSVGVVLSGTNSIVTDKQILFDNQFYIAKP